MTTNSHSSVPDPEPGADAGIDELQADIERTRAQLGQTVEALSAKADVKGRAKTKVADTRDAVLEKAHDAQSAARRAITDDHGAVKQPVPIGAIVVVAALVVAVVVWRRRT